MIIIIITIKRTEYILVPALGRSGHSTYCVTHSFKDNSWDVSPSVFVRLRSFVRSFVCVFTCLFRFLCQSVPKHKTRTRVLVPLQSCD